MSIFSSVRVRRPKKNLFKMNPELKLSGRMSDLIPCMCIEVVPGDTFMGMSEMLCRFAPMTHPIMHNINARIEYFFVPNRLVMEGWEDFITGGQHVKGSAPVTPPPIPTMKLGVPNSFSLDEYKWESFPEQLKPGSLIDYLGLPTIDKELVEPESPLAINYTPFQTDVSILPMRAYQLIYDEYYRDQSLEPESTPFRRAPTYEFDGEDDGTPVLKINDPDGLLTLRKRAWQKDYFTSALPWAQKGEVDIPISLKEGANVYLDTDSYNDIQYIVDPATGQKQPQNLKLFAGGTYGLGVGEEGPNAPGVLDPNGTLKVDAEAESGTITDLRRAFKLQEWLEKQALAGSRYIETIMSHFGVKGKDARLQRPQFLGGGKIPVVISEVVQHSATTREGNETTSVLGDLAGHAVAVGNTANFSFTADEHGYIIGIFSVMPDTGYMQGIPRHFFKFDKFDFYWPEFAHIGEQEVKNKELFFAWNSLQSNSDPSSVVSSDDDNEFTFGYQSRYSEYKHMPNTVHGDFRTSLLSWHMARKFERRPNLNNTFIKPGSSTIDRPFSVQEDANQHIWVEMVHHIKAWRPMPYFGTPRM